MMNLDAYMKKTGVTKKKYVTDWLEKGLIPGVLKDEATGEYTFPESARRPYQCGSLKANAKAPQLRAHIVKACVSRQHITHNICFMSEGEFSEMVNDLVRIGLVKIRIEDGITYYDSTEKSDMYYGWPLKKIANIVNDTISNITEAAAKGAVTAYLTVGNPH